MVEHDAQEKKLLATVLKADIVNQTCLFPLDVIVFKYVITMLESISDGTEC